MICSEFEDLMLDEIDGRIVPDMANRLHDHLGHCEACRSFLALQVEIDHSLAVAVRPSERFLPLRIPPVREVAVWWDITGLVSVAAASGLAVAYLLPHTLVGAPWIVAAIVLCGGAWLTLAEPPVPSV